MPAHRIRSTVDEMQGGLSIHFYGMYKCIVQRAMSREVVVVWKKE